MNRFLTGVVAATIAAVVVVAVMGGPLIDNVRIPTSGVLRYDTYVTAQSGSLDDIQAAINTAVSTGKANVLIPEGVFTFAARPGKSVDIPGGINVIGAGQNKTVLRLDHTTYSGVTMFYAHGENGLPIRISGIYFLGKNWSDTQATGDAAIELDTVKDFRIDHNKFEALGSVAVYVNNNYMDSNPGTWLVSQGVVDHNIFWNIYKSGTIAAGTGYAYGVAVQKGNHQNTQPWDPNISHLMGNATDTVFVENNYFRGLRHCVMQDGAGRYVARFNYIERGANAADNGQFMFDSHPPRYYGENYYGGRWVEIYNNTIVGNQGSSYDIYGMDIAGGAGIITSNTFRLSGASHIYYAYAFDLSTSYSTGTPQSFINIAKPHDIYIWNNKGDQVGNVVSDNPYIPYPGQTSIGTSPSNDVRLYNPANDGFTYSPYQYPHPLTLIGP